MMNYKDHQDAIITYHREVIELTAQKIELQGKKQTAKVKQKLESIENELRMAQGWLNTLNSPAGRHIR